MSATWVDCVVLWRGEDGLWSDGFVIAVNPMHESNQPWRFTILTHNALVEVVEARPLCHDFRAFDCVRRGGSNSLSESLPASDIDIVASLKLKYSKKGIYTMIGPVLFSINPFEKLPLYDPIILEAYIRAGTRNYVHLLPAHVFVVADMAYRHMFMDPFDTDRCENQTILITGDSGAGKTACTKQVIRYLLALSGTVCGQYGESTDYEVEMEDLVLSSIPVTEAFGNAKTHANNNSSRYGKYIELFFSGDGYLEGAAARTYLLEYSRVCQPPPGEHSFHIFYDMLDGLPQDKRKVLGLTRALDFFYLSHSSSSCCTSTNATSPVGVGGAARYAELTASMDKFGFSEHCQFEIFKIIASVLHVGNIDFLPSPPWGAPYGNDTAFPIAVHPSSNESVQWVCSLLSIAPDDLMRSFVRTKKVLFKGGEHTRECESGSDVDDGSANGATATARLLRDRLAMTLYVSVFNWVMVELNRKLGEKTGDSCVATMGLLDTMGFETGSSNSLQQLCINYGAEKLHHHMLERLFFSEAQVYEEEGVPWRTPRPLDNIDILDTFESRRTGIFSCLKFRSSATDADIMATLSRRNRQVSVLSDTNGVCQFRVRHSNRDVTYNAFHFMEKNRGIREINFSALFVSSEGRVQSFDSDNTKFLKSISSVVSGDGSQISSVGTSRCCHERASRPKRSDRQSSIEQSPSALSDDSREVKLSMGRHYRTVSASFQDDMTALISRIRNTRSHFIKCINPNDRKARGEFDTEYVSRQFRHGELRSLASLHMELYPVRIATEIWVRKYRVCLSPVGICTRSKEVFDLLKEAYTSRKFKYAARGIAIMLPIAGRVLYLLSGDETLMPDSELLTRGLRVENKHVFLSRSCHYFLEHLRSRSLEFIVLRLQCLRTLARAPVILSANILALSSLCARRHFLTKRLRQEVMGSIVIRRCLRRWVQLGGNVRLRKARTLRRAYSARRIQGAWQAFCCTKRKRQVGIATLN